MSQYAPRIYTMKIPTDKIRELIGPGGKVIRGIIEQTGVKIDVDDDGTVNIFAADERSGANAPSRWSAISRPSPRSGKTYLGKVVRIVGFRRVCRDLPGHRRPAAYQRDLGEPHQERAR